VIAVHRRLRCLRKAADIAAPHPTQFIVLDLLARHGALRVGELAARTPPRCAGGADPDMSRRRLACPAAQRRGYGVIAAV
jgi:hypothetical protein